jgi:hypothetical protein
MVSRVWAIFCNWRWVTLTAGGGRERKQRVHRKSSCNIKQLCLDESYSSCGCLAICLHCCLQFYAQLPNCQTSPLSISSSRYVILRQICRVAGNKPGIDCKKMFSDFSPHDCNLKTCSQPLTRVSEPIKPSGWYLT